MIPARSSDTLYSSIPLLESSQPLGAGASIPSGNQSAYVDLVDLLRTMHSEVFFYNLGVKHTYRPAAADPRWFLYYHIYAEGAAGIPAPGDLMIRMVPLDTATAAGGPTALVDAAFEKDAYHVPFTGAALSYNQATSTTVTERAAGLTGKIQIEGRAIAVVYRNAYVAQVTFHLGVYLRPV